MSEEARELVGNYLRSLRNGQVHSRNGLAALATKLVALSGNPRDACLRFLHQLGVTQKRVWRPWTKPEQQRLFDLIETCPLEEVSKIMQRSPRSIRSMLHRLGETSQRGRDWFTVYSLAEALHVRSDEVQKWIDHGWLKCRIVETTGVKKRIIDPEDFSEFVKQYGRAVVGRRLNSDGLWFVQMLCFRRSTHICCRCEKVRICLLVMLKKMKTKQTVPSGRARRGPRESTPNRRLDRATVRAAAKRRTPDRRRSEKRRAACRNGFLGERLGVKKSRSSEHTELFPSRVTIFSCGGVLFAVLC